MNTFLEITAVISGLVYLFFLMKEQKICWFFGVFGSLLSILLFYRTHLYSESILYIYYVVIGVYGYLLWSKHEKMDKKLAISKWSLESHLLVVVIGVLASLLLGYIFDNYTQAKNAYVDAATTIFSFIASYLEAKKILSAWLFWIVINGVTIWLYNQRTLDYYTALTVLYFVLSFVGFYRWNKRYKAYSNASKAIII